MTKSRIFLFLIFLSTFVLPVWAQVQTPIRPNFPECESPQGLLKVDYPEGIHGVPGDSTTYTGSDTVYNLSEETLTQCFCSTNGNGIQTNWWKISSLTLEEVQILQGLGWVYVPNGAEWGLQEAPYMTYSSEYICKENPKKRTGGEVNDDPPSKDKKKHKDSNGEVLGASTYIYGDILGLASTGNTKELAILASAGVGFLYAAIKILSKKSTRV